MCSLCSKRTPFIECINLCLCSKRTPFIECINVYLCSKGTPFINSIDLLVALPVAWSKFGCQRACAFGHGFACLGKVYLMAYLTCHAPTLSYWKCESRDMHAVVI